MSKRWAADYSATRKNYINTESNDSESFHLLFWSKGLKKKKKNEKWPVTFQSPKVGLLWRLNKKKMIQFFNNTRFWKLNFRLANNEMCLELKLGDSFCCDWFSLINYWAITRVTPVSTSARLIWQSFQTGSSWCNPKEICTLSSNQGASRLPLHFIYNVCEKLTFWAERKQ